MTNEFMCNKVDRTGILFFKHIFGETNYLICIFTEKVKIMWDNLNWKFSPLRTEKSYNIFQLMKYDKGISLLCINVVTFKRNNSKFSARVYIHYLVMNTIGLL